MHHLFRVLLFRLNQSDLPVFAYRNKSYLAHGSNPINPDVVRKLMELYTSIMDEFIDREELSQGHQAAQFANLNI